MIGINWLGTLRLRMKARTRLNRTVHRRRTRHRSGRLGLVESLETRTLLTPAIASFDLYNDTSTPGDYITVDPTVTGTVTSNGGDVTLEFDYNGDGEADDWGSIDSNGVFVHNTGTYLAGYGNVTIAVRAGELDWQTWTTVYSGWATLDFTWYSEPPQIASFGALNNVGTAEYQTTVDGLLTGSATNPDGSAAGLYVELDFNGDGLVDEYAMTDGEGDFTFDMMSAPGFGEHIIRARAAETMPHYVAGDWVSLNIEFLAPPMITSFSVQETSWHRFYGEGYVDYYDPTLLAIRFEGVVNLTTTPDPYGRFSVGFDLDYSGPLTVVAIDQFGRESHVWQDYVMVT